MTKTKAKKQQANKKMNAPVIIGCAVAVMAVAGITMALLSNGSSETKVPERVEISAIDGEGVAITGLRLASVQGGTLLTSNCRILQGLARKFDRSTDWFECSGSFYAGTADTQNNNVTLLSDGNYCATFTTDKDFNYLVGYTFERGSCAGELKRIFISETY